MAVWQILFCLTVVAFVSRAIIPMGYMPDASSTRNTTFAITVCSMGMATPMLMDASGQLSAPAQSDDGYLPETCPFGLIAAEHIAPGQDTPTLAAVLRFATVVDAATSQVLPPQPLQGPPLGSRGPPAALV